MPRTLPIAAAESKMSEIVAGMVPGEELVLTTDGEPVAIVTRPARSSWPCQPGTAFEWLPISDDHFAVVVALPFHHKDPFDRLLVAQATREKIAIISADAIIDRYDVRRLW
jgi:antitoxin (DNA-binding transcriptional repressor) of toxin-antitoxin stability system